MILVITILCLHLVQETPRGANILRNITNMSQSMLSDQQMQTEFHKEQLLLGWMLSEGFGMGQDRSTISVQLDYQCSNITQIKMIVSISLGC